MKTIKIIFIFLACFSTIAFANNISLGVVGIYEGKVFNTDSQMPVVTTLHVEKGVLSGEYVITEPDGITRGELFNFRQESMFTYVCEWKDRYGVGVLRILFAANFSEFYGFWGYNLENTVLVFNGVRQK